ncbi:hypothetical protein QFC22_005836 [Naganishia vaughanmartiniae]|uniref:Uncharacterized protein n=1 Tax=Naganishia vaughanmartiniae TaxID=1424756 RepID=A0ACC2WSD7_9TREE|nr:hypothetical protein QFC22_005836 [Naganishia vaughanmartiniae]
MATQQQHSIEHLGLGQPVGSAAATGAEEVRGNTKVQDGPVSVPVSTQDSTATPSSTSHTTQVTGKEIPTTNPAVHVVLTNPPTPERHSSNAMPPAVARARAETNASVISTASSRSYASTTTTSSGFTGDGEDDDDDADDYDPASAGGDAGEKSCLKEKRIKEWRKRFHPKDGEELLCTHGCALVIEIMIHGRMYVSNKRICFRSNILGVRTKREIPIKHIHAVALRNVAGMIPNSFEVYYNDKKSQFTTLPDRDHILRILMRQWKQENSQVYDLFMDKHPEFASYVVDNASPTTSGSNVVVPPSSTTAAAAAAAGNDEKLVVPAESNGAAAAPGDEGAAVASEDSTARAGGRPRAATIANTQDLEKVALDTILPSEPEKIYKLLYHNDDFLQGIWKEQGFKDIQMQPWSDKKRDFSFARPVASIGSTTCKNSEKIVHPEGQDEWFCVEGVTSTPGVPSGKSFSTKSKTVFTWAEGGGTKMHVTYQVEWTGKSLLKGTITSQSESGQKQWNTLLANKIRSYIKSHPEEFPPTKGAPAGAGEDDEAEDVGAGEGAQVTGTTSTVTSGKKGATSTATEGEPRDPMSAVQSQLNLLQTSGPIAYLMDDPIRAFLLLFFTAWLLTHLLSTAKRLLWTGKVVSIPLKRLTVLEAAEKELKVLVGDVRGQLERAGTATAKATQTVSKVVVDAGTKVVGGSGVVGGTGKVIKRTVVP